jgi:hypothetical protein
LEIGLSIKDLITTVLVFVVGWISYFQIKGNPLPYLSNIRLASLVVLILGFVICTVGAGNNIWPVKTSNPFLVISAALGFIALIVGVVGIISGNKLVFEVLAGIIILNWLIATFRHLLG